MGQIIEEGRTSPRSYLHFPIFPQFKLSTYEGFEFEFKVNLECGGLGKTRGRSRKGIWVENVKGKLSRSII